MPGAGLSLTDLVTERRAVSVQLTSRHESARSTIVSLLVLGLPGLQVRVRDGVVHVVPEDRRLICPGRPVDLSAAVTNSLGWAHARRVAEAVTTTDGPSRSFSESLLGYASDEKHATVRLLGGRPRPHPAGLPL
jgi:hypothetical protein